MGIVAFSAERNVETPTQMQAYGRLQNFGESEATVVVSLLRDGNVAASGSAARLRSSSIEPLLLRPALAVGI